MSNLAWILIGGLLASGCGGVEVDGVSDGMQPAPIWPEAGVAEPAPPLSVDEIDQLAFDYMHEPLADNGGDPLAHLRSLSPEDGKRFRDAVADLNQLSGLSREMFDAFTDVAYEHRVFVLDATPELAETALWRALGKYADDWGPERVEFAVDRILHEWFDPVRVRPPPTARRSRAECR